MKVSTYGRVLSASVAVGAVVGLGGYAVGIMDSVQGLTMGLGSCLATALLLGAQAEAEAWKNNPEGRSRPDGSVGGDSPMTGLGGGCDGGGCGGGGD
jgi:hypothetical protein